MTLQAPALHFPICRGLPQSHLLLAIEKVLIE